MKFPKETIQAIAKSIRGEDKKNVENNTSTAEKNVKTITITYKAKLNNDAEMSNHVEVLNNKNIAKLTYDEIIYTDDTEQKIKSGQLSAEVDVRTTDFQINKFAVDKDYLEGATFKIYDALTGGDEIKVTKDGDTNTYHVNPEEKNDVSIKSVDNENVTIKGLKIGTYYIEETAAPDGYNKIQDRMKLVIAEDTDKIYSYNRRK
ncbi:MAG: SpaA isopeptide-forming pilin-related protein [Anaerococcus sp.]